MGTTRARPSQHSQVSEPPPPAISSQPALNQTLLQQQNGTAPYVQLGMSRSHTCGLDQNRPLPPDQDSDINERLFLDQINSFLVL